MPAAPFLAYLDTIRSLQGEAKVSYPDEDLDYPVTERVERIARGTTLKPYYSPEPNATRFPHNLLTMQQETGGDRQNAEFYYRYERLPSRRNWSKIETDEEAAVDIYQGTWTDRSGVSAPAVGGSINVELVSGTIANCVVLTSTSQLMGQVRTKITVTACKLPGKRAFKKSRGYSFPALFNPLRGWIFDRDFQFPPPYLGTNFTLISARTLTVTAREEYTYSVGPTNALPTPFFVVTRAAGSRCFRGITANTVHPAFFDIEYETDSTSGARKSALIESFAASTPATYSPQQTLIIEAEEQPWRGPIWRQRIVKVREAGNL